MKHRITFLTAIMLLSMTSAFAQGGTAGPLTWNISGGTLTISGNGAMPDYDAGGNKAPWYQYHENIYTVVIETGVTSIGHWAFYLCDYMTSAIISNSVTSIGFYAFVHCGLTSITIPNSITTIGEEAFSSCISLTSITIPNSVTTIGSRAFYYCTSLTSINVESGNSSYASEDGVLFDKNKIVLICCPAGKVGEYVIPNGVTTIGNSAFAGCSSLFSITISNSVTTIGDWAFSSCASLSSITTPNSVITIGEGAFFHCASLTSITIGSNVTTIGHNAFYVCGLTSVTIPNSVTFIGVEAFFDCPINTITISENVTDIGTGAFFNNNLSTINFNASPKRIWRWTERANYPTFGSFDENSFLTINIGNSVDSIKNYLFSTPDDVYGYPHPYYPQIASITTYAETPPVLSTNAFLNASKNIPVHIPCYTYDSYSNASGWKDFTNFIDLGANYKPELCMISVDENDHNEIVWKKHEEATAYSIFREGTQGGQYDLIATIEPDAPNKWVDMESNAKIRSYRYKISYNNNVCGETPLSPTHKTMHLTINAGQNNSWNLIWTAYEGTAYSTYNIYRATGDVIGEFSLIGTMPSGNTSFSDFGAPAEGYVYYMVEIVLNEDCSGGKAFSSIKSNVATNNPGGVGIVETDNYPSLRVYPNPTDGEIQVTSYELQVTSIEIFDVMGRTVGALRATPIVGQSEIGQSEIVINVAHLPNGVYFLRIQTEIGVVTRKIIKN